MCFNWGSNVVDIAVFQPDTGLPLLPACPLKVCLLGKSFAGKSTCAAKLAESEFCAALFNNISSAFLS